MRKLTVLLSFFSFLFLVSIFFPNDIYSQTCDPECVQNSDCREYCEDENGNLMEDCTYSCTTVTTNDCPYGFKQCVYTQDNPGQGGYQCTNWCPWGECKWDNTGNGYFQVRFCCDGVNTDEMQIRQCAPNGNGDGGGGGGTPSCTVDLTPDTSTITLGSDQTFTASISNVQNGSVDSADFSSSNTTIATVNPSSDVSAVYSTQVTGQGFGSASITTNVIMGGASRCSDVSSVTVTTSGPWWQVGDADIITNGNLFSLIPAATCLLPGCDPAFGLEGPGGYPGVPSYGGSYDFEAGSGTGSVSSTGWLANTTTTFSRVYDYSYFQALVRPDVIINEIIEPEIQGGYLINQGTSSRGYVWFRRQGDLTITGTANLQDRKVVLLVDGDLYLGRPPGQSGSSIRVRDGTGFFMAIVSGDIIISSKARIDPLNPQPILEGIFLAEGQVKTGTDGAGLDEQLWIRGSVAAYGGVVLERDLTDNSLTPAEFIEYGPDFLFTFPRDLTSRRYKWKEVAP